MNGKPGKRMGGRCGRGTVAVLAALLVAGAAAFPAQIAPPPQPQLSPAEASAALDRWEGRTVARILFEGVPAERLDPLPAHLAQAPGAPLRAEDLRRSLRQLYATGLYEKVDARAWPEGEGLALLFAGVPRAFIGATTVLGAKGATLNTQLASAAQLGAGTRFTQARIEIALATMRSTLEQNGFREATITYKLNPRPEEQLVDIAFLVVPGRQARIGAVEVAGDPGMNVDEFRHHAHLRAGARIDHDTANRALTGILRYYQGRQRLEAEIKLEAQQYAPATGRSSFRFLANRGPQVSVRLNGASVSQGRLRRLIPIFEEGSVDDDLLNEGNRRLRDYYQRLGYFDVKVDHEVPPAAADPVVIVYNVALGPRRRVLRVAVQGNRYFDSPTLVELLNVHPAGGLDRHGVYSQALVAADIATLESVYRNNGFSAVKVTSSASTGSPEPGGKVAPLTVVYHIAEGLQQRVGSVTLEGNQHAGATRLAALLNTIPGQLFSPQAVANDRDALLTDYLSRGFDQARVEVAPLPRDGAPGIVDVVFHIVEGQQIFVRKVLITGLRYTRPDTVARAITLHPGDPLNESALLETQRNLYDFALFNQVDLAVENPSGSEIDKTVLLQAVEARRWALTYGFGAEAQTGTPQNNCANAIAAGVRCSPNGKLGASPRILVDITRNALFGRDQSASLQGTYGLLEQRLKLLYQNPHFYGNRDFGFTFSGGYANSQDVTTYVASKLEAGVRWTEHFSAGSRLSRANTLDYEFSFRRVKVSATSLQVYLKEIPELSTAVRVAGPGITWIRDTRDSPLDAHRGSYTSFQEFLSGNHFGAEVEFNRLDLSNSSYYSFGKGRFVVARNTRYGQERAYGKGNQQLLPLPERLYAGGPTSLRGFSINAAGPRDPITGYPVGGAGAMVNSTELRLPPPSLPWLGNSVSLVLFHDMGNVFANASDAWASAVRIHQPDRDTCKQFDNPPTGPITSTGQQGACSFNYFSHAPGLGLRYHTPVGPIRFDFSYNLNPPIYPVIYDYSHTSAKPHVGEANHFNFFFSLGQSF
ncbi:MAG: POTRA domain-containing protein [Terracidiphilus sp.]